MYLITTCLFENNILTDSEASRLSYDLYLHIEEVLTALFSDYCNIVSEKWQQILFSSFLHVKLIL